jgi:hypothetical protein
MAQLPLKVVARALGARAKNLDAGEPNVTRKAVTWPQTDRSLILPTLLAGAITLSTGVGCRQQATTSADTTDTETLTVGEVNDDAGLKVAIGPDVTYPAYLHPKGDSDWSAECSIDQTEVLTSAADKYCVYEGREEDLHFHGGALHYNVPSDMCSYFVVRPYWYYQYETANGPATFAYDVDEDGAFGRDSDNNGTINTVDTSSANALVVANEIACKYDYTNEDGPNCCLGEYTSTIRTWDASLDPDGDGTPNPGYVTTTESGEWGGDAGSCLSGSAVDTQDKNDEGYPIPSEYYVDGTGVNDVYTIASPVSKTKASNLYIANADFSGAGSTTEVDNDLFGDLRGSTKRSRYYGFECYDRAFELQARIRVEIQDWNQEAEFALQSAGDPDSGDDPSDVEDTPFGEEPINDHWDWHTFVDQLGVDTAYPEASD